MTDHPTPSDFKRFLRGAASPVVNIRVVRHLLAICPDCRATLTEMGWTLERLARLTTLPPVYAADLTEITFGSDYTHEEALLSASSGYQRNFGYATPLRSGRDLEVDAPAGWANANIEAAPIDAEDLVPDVKVVNGLIGRSHAARHQGPGMMLHWARAARTMAERCDELSAGGRAQLANLRARAWGEFGNALRTNGSVKEAVGAVKRAKAYWDEGTGDRALRILLLNWIACLYTSQLRFSQAVDLLDEAVALSEASGVHLDLARSLVNKAVAIVCSGDPERASRILDETIYLIGPSDPQLRFAAHHNLIVCRLEAGRLKEALALTSQAHRLGQELGDRLLISRILWQRGKILAELGRLEEAEVDFLRAREGFVSLGFVYPAALVSIEVTAIYVKLGLAAEVRRTLADALPIFSSLKVGREFLASVIRLQQAEDQAQALQLIRSLSWELRAGPKLHPSD